MGLIFSLILILFSPMFSLICSLIFATGTYLTCQSARASLRSSAWAWLPMRASGRAAERAALAPRGGVAE